MRTRHSNSVSARPQNHPQIADHFTACCQGAPQGQHRKLINRPTCAWKTSRGVTDEASMRARAAAMSSSSFFAFDDSTCGAT